MLHSFKGIANIPYQLHQHTYLGYSSNIETNQYSNKLHKKEQPPNNIHISY